MAPGQNFQSGATVRLDCRATGYPQPRVRWYVNAQEVVSDGDRSQVFSNGTLIIKKLRAGDAGVYQCQAGNEHTTASDSLRIFVTGTQNCSYLDSTLSYHVHFHGSSCRNICSKKVGYDVSVLPHRSTVS